MKIYTKTGDRGQTDLYGGQRVAKDTLRVTTLGTVDECNAALGLALALGVDPDAAAILTRLQGELFELGADLATPMARGDGVPRIQPAETARLEAEIDRMEDELAPLRKFILPGGGTGGAALHLARTICRRAERHLVALQAQEEVNPEAARYVNRLSDHLFVLARAVNARAGAKEAEWTRPAKAIEGEDHA